MWAEGRVSRLGAGVRVLGAAALFAFAAVAFTPLAAVVDARMDHGSEIGPAEAVVVLGAGVGPEGVLQVQSLRRAVLGITLFRRGLAPRIVMLGPAAEGGVVEAEVRAALARDLGVPAEAIVSEARGLTTREEARLTRARLGPGARRILLVTGAHHMGRARALFRREGFEVLRAPVDEVSARSSRPEDRLEVWRLIAQEAVARAYNRLAGGL